MRRLISTWTGALDEPFNDGGQALHARIRVTVAVLVRSDVGDMSLMEEWLMAYVVLCEPAGGWARAAARSSMR